MIEIAPMTADDWPAVAAIYAEGIATGNATFAPAPPVSWKAWEAGRITGCSLIARDGAQMLGWACASPTSSRAVYAGVAEHSIYIAAVARGRGVGSMLLGTFIITTELHGIWALQASIFPENEASARLHVRHGFRLVGRREQVGLMTYGPWGGQWRDTLLIERRSSVVGVS